MPLDAERKSVGNNNSVGNNKEGKSVGNNKEETILANEWVVEETRSAFVNNKIRTRRQESLDFWKEKKQQPMIKFYNIKP